MKAKTIVVMGLLGVLGASGYFAWKYFSREKKLLEEYGVDLLGVKFSNFSEDLITAVFTIRITNKSAIEATIQRLYADVYMNNAYVGYVANDGEFIIPSKGSSDVQLKITVATKELLKNIVGTLLTLAATKDVPYRLKGYVKLKSAFIGGSIPFEYNGFLKSDMLSSAVPVMK